jgi:protoporphyrinogen oxidase
MTRRWVILGGGVVGLLAARTIKAVAPGAQVVVVERAEEAGGLLAGETSICGRHSFDRGTHIFRETGDLEIDAFIQEAIPADEIIIFPSGSGDLAGAIFNGREQNNSHFIDIRARGDAAELKRSLLMQASVGRAPQIDRLSPALEAASRRFGETFSDRVLMPALEKVFLRDRSELAAFAFLLPGLTRVVAMDEAEWLAVAAHDDRVRDIIAVPDQRQLPPTMRSMLRSFYVRRGGTKYVIARLCAALKYHGVEMMLGATVERLDLPERSMEVVASDGRRTRMDFDGIVLAVGAVPAARLLGVEIAEFRFDRPLSHRLIHLEAETVKDSDLCYFYGLDSEVDFYRVTNYRAFSGDHGDRRLTIEVLGERADDEDALITRIERQLRELGWIDGVLRYASVTKLPAGFPTPTVQNLDALASLSEHIGQLLPPYALLAGVGARPGLFFQNEVVVDAVRSLRERL